MHRVHIKITGLVQGVFFRAHTREKAVKMGLTGWVRNTPDGSVEAEAEGEKVALEKFIAWCQKGPPSAHVMDVQTEWSSATGEFKGFAIRY